MPLVRALPILLALFTLVPSVAPAQTDLQKAQNLTTCLAGRYPSLCRREWLTAEELRKADAAELRENLSTCLTGRYPTLCKKAKLTPEELQQVLAAEKRVNLETCLTGRYKALCKKNLLTESERTQVAAAERVANLQTCLSGTAPTLCDRSLLTREQAVQAQAAEKRAAETGRQLTPRGRSAPTARAGRSGCDDGHWIDSVSSNGRIITLEDGSVWEVDAADRIDSALWLPISNVIACDDKLINTDDGETVSARRIR